jgi:D-arginine dehydrogenase
MSTTASPRDAAGDTTVDASDPAAGEARPPVARDRPVAVAAAADAHHDVAVVGGGIVGAAIACFLSPVRRVLLLEAEGQPGMHATGRSAALFTEAYGPPMVRALTRASRAFFEAPPAGFATVPLLHRRGTLFVGSAAQRDAVSGLQRRLAEEGIAAQWLDSDAVQARVPVLRPEAAACGLLDGDAFDIDVDALLQGFLRRARHAGARVRTGARLTALSRAGGRWQLHTADGEPATADVVVDAAGAWADEVAALAGARPIGIEPRRRSAFLFAAPEGVETARWPAVIAIDESWYFKPDAGLLLGSPANADPVAPHDVVAEEIDVALGIDRIERATTLTIRRPRSTWAGLRSFVVDGEPVCGFDDAAPGFFWAAAVGGYGIQSSPAFGRLCAALIAGLPAPPDIAAQGLSLGALLPQRLRAGG